MIEAPVDEKTVWEIRRSRRLRGSLELPGDAHLSLLAVGLAALSPGETRLGNLPQAPWFQSFRAALESWGVGFTPSASDPGVLLIRGGAWHPADEPLTASHDLAALILAGIGGGAGLRPAFLYSAEVGEDVKALLASLYPPEASNPDFEAEFRPGELHRQARNFCQPCEHKWDDGLAKTVLIFHHLAAGQSLELHLQRPGSDLLESLLPHFGLEARIERDDAKDADELTRRMARQLRAAGKEPVTRLKLPAGHPAPATLSLPGDVGEAAVAALAATVIKGSDLLLENVLLHTGRGAIFAALRRMGADLEVLQRRERRGEVTGTLRVRAADLFGKRFDAETLADGHDEAYLLLAAAALAQGESVFRDLDFLRGGPVDRLKEFVAALKRAGVEIGEFEDGLVIRGKHEFDGGAYDALGHAGLAAACAVLGLKSHGASTLAGAEAFENRYPDLRARLETLAGGEKNS